MGAGQILLSVGTLSWSLAPFARSTASSGFPPIARPSRALISALTVFTFPIAWFS